MIFLCGCVNLRHDVSDDLNAWFPYAPNNEYATRETMFLIMVDSGLEPKHIALVPPAESNRGPGYYSSPNSIEGYYKDPQAACKKNLSEEFRINVIGVVESGTKFVPYKIKRNSGWNIWFGNHTNDIRYGKITSGKYNGSIVDIEDVSWCMEAAPILNRFIEIK
jgi:hypothetical protein